MANNTQLNTNVTAGDTIATEDIAGVKHELVKVEFGADGVATKVSAADPLPVTTDGLTNTELRATPVPVSGTVTVDTSTLATAAKQDTGNSSLSSILAKIITAPATEAKQDIGNTSLSTIAGKDFATQTTLALIKAKTDNIDVALSTRTKPADQQHVIIDSGTVTVDTTGLATSAKQDTGNTSLASIDGKLTNPLPVSGTVTTGGLTDTQLTVTATATDLDIRNLVFATDKVDASGTVLGAGNNNIGDVDVASVTGNVTVVQGTGTNLHTVIDSGTITTVSTVTAVTAISNALPAGNNNIGDVDVATLPALVAGSAIIGNVRIDQTTPGTTNGVQVNAALPAGANVIGHVITDTGSTTAVTGTVTTAPAVPTTILNGKTTVATAGSRTTLAASTAVKSVTIKALSTNTGFIYVGDTTVASTNGFQLSARDSVSLDLANLNTINIDSSVNGEGVTYLAVN